MAGQASGTASAKDLIGHLVSGSMLLAGKRYDASVRLSRPRKLGPISRPRPIARIRSASRCLSTRRAISSSASSTRFVLGLYPRIKQFRYIAARYRKLAENYAAALKLVAVRIWVRDL